MHPVRLSLSVLACLALVGPATAQVTWDMPNIILKKPVFADPTAKPRAEAWPRLDPGSVLCKSEADLLRLAAARRGEPGDPPACQLIRSPTAVTIEKRAGPGRTQVSLTDQKGVDGWTDAWLPEKPPPVGGKGVSIR
jgi:hypothetical protein